jgi:hypothetical protein
VYPIGLSRLDWMAVLLATGSHTLLRYRPRSPGATPGAATERLQGI